MAVKPTTCKEAIARWEKEKGENAADATVIELQFQWPPIEKMDGALSTLVNCEPSTHVSHFSQALLNSLTLLPVRNAFLNLSAVWNATTTWGFRISLWHTSLTIHKADFRKLSLSSNMIDKIAGIAGMRNLKILSLGRNYIKSLAGVETVAETLEELWISYNPIDKLKGVGTLKNLKVLYMSNNAIKEWVEFNRLQECPNLRDLVFIGNPICENQPDVETWRTQASNRLQQITKLDGIPILRDTD